MSIEGFMVSGLVRACQLCFVLIGLLRNRLGNCDQTAIQEAHAAFLCHLSEGWALKVKLQTEGVCDWWNL